MARRLEDKPFHLIASHCQDTSNRKEVIAFLRNNDMSAFAPNLTITKQGRHPDVPGNGFVPYYIVFDHTGKLVHHHMCGSYHGGDGLKMIEWVDDLLAKTPAIYLGAEPFERIAPLARKVESGKGLAASVKKLEAALATPPDEATQAELERLRAILARHRDGKLARIEALWGTQPSRVVAELQDLAKALHGTALGEEVGARLEAARASGPLKDAVKLEKAFRKVVKGYEKVKSSKRTEKLTERTVAKLEKLIEGKQDLPFVRTVEAWLKDLR